jgi:hypothetical protein
LLPFFVEHKTRVLRLVLERANVAPLEQLERLTRQVRRREDEVIEFECRLEICRRCLSRGAMCVVADVWRRLRDLASHQLAQIDRAQAAKAAHTDQ